MLVDLPLTDGGRLIRLEHKKSEKDALCPNQEYRHCDSWFLYNSVLWLHVDNWVRVDIWVHASFFLEILTLHF